MVLELSSEQLAKASERIAIRTGMSFPPERWTELRFGLKSAAGELGLPGVGALVEMLTAGELDPGQWAVLYEQLTIGETYFLREPLALEALERVLLPELVNQCAERGRPLKIWCAGCSTGEEPYSVAMVLRRSFPLLLRGGAMLLATDLNEKSLEKARGGRYRDWSFRGAPDWVAEYFTRDGEWMEIAPELRAAVHFERLNLVEDPLPARWAGDGMDVILCRNVLMYFVPQAAERVVDKIFDLLRPGGYLLVGANELSADLFRRFEAVMRGGAHLFRRPEPQSEAGRGSTARGAPRRVPPSIAQTRPATPSPVPTTGEPTTALVTEALQRARRLADERHLAEALAVSLQVEATAPFDPHVHYLHALVLQEMGAEGDAIEALQRALHLDPNLVPAHVALGNLHLAGGRVADAQRHFEQALAILRRLEPESVIPESEGTTAAALAAMVGELVERAAAGR